MRVLVAHECISQAAPTLLRRPRKQPQEDIDEASAVSVKPAVAESRIDRIDDDLIGRNLRSELPCPENIQQFRSVIPLLLRAECLRLVHACKDIRSASFLEGDPEVAF